MVIANAAISIIDESAVFKFRPAINAGTSRGGLKNILSSSL